jgi:hypothetical protein
MVLYLFRWFLILSVPGQTYGFLQVHFGVAVIGGLPMRQVCWGVVLLHGPILCVWEGVGIVVH